MAFRGQRFARCFLLPRGAHRVASGACVSACCRDISFRSTDGLPLRPASVLQVDCGGHALDLYSEAGRFKLPPYGSIEFYSCHVNTFEDHTDAQSDTIHPTSPQNVFGGAGAKGGRILAFNSTIRWFDAVRVLSVRMPSRVCLPAARARQGHAACMRWGHTLCRSAAIGCPSRCARVSRGQMHVCTHLCQGCEPLSLSVMVLELQRAS